jgi:mono/diheme cytochrome c family protein
MSATAARRDAIVPCPLPPSSPFCPAHRPPGACSRRRPPTASRPRCRWTSCCARHPPLPGKQAGAGPFYVVWERPEAARISPEYWPYQLAALRIVEPPAVRWPQIAVEASLPADHPARRGQEVYGAICLACHRMNGGGSGEMGPDLNQPMNPTEYFQPAALRRYLRDPASLRSWPEQKMPGFGPDQISETDLDALIAYLEHMAARRPEGRR